MDLSLPTALIVGIENFGAKQLAIELLTRGLNVIGVGDYVSGMEEQGNFENRMKIDDVEERVTYIFDFEGKEEAKVKAEEDGAKLVEVEINGKKNRLINQNGVKKIKIHGMYGQEMDGNPDSLSEVIEKAAREAVKNKNLTVPKKEGIIRLMSTTDGAEAIIRMALMPGVGDELIEIWGEGIRAGVLAEKLINLAKMTRTKVVEEGEVEEIDSRRVEEGWKQLRWQPQSDWDKEIELMLQYFFTEADEENRRGKETRNTKQVTRIEPEEERTRMVPEVVVEEEEREKPKAQSPTEEDFEIDKIEIKNSNARPVVEELEEEEMEREIEMEKPEEIVIPKFEIPVREEEKISDVRSEIKEEKPQAKSPKIKIKLPEVKGLVWTAVVLMGLGGLILGVNGVRGWMIFSGLKKGVSLVEAKKYEEAEKVVAKQYTAANDWDNEISASGFNRWVWGRRWQDVLRVFRDVAVVETGAIKIAKNGEQINEAIFGEKDIDWEKTVGAVKEEMVNTAETMGKLEARLGGDWSWLPGRFKSQISTYKQKISQERNVVMKGVKLISIAPDFLGTDGKRRDYLILFQNENELRPSGGFIGSYGVITFNGGKMANLEVQDIYEADGQLKGHVEPPEPIKKYLGEGGWYMRDANWQSDFREASKEILWFFEKETGRKVDGVVAMNLSLAKAILGVTGEVFVPDFKEKVNKDNLYEQAEFYAETKFFPGSTQKASFLGMLTKQLLEQVKSMEVSKKAELIEALMEKADEREVQINLANNQSQTTIGDLGWDGAMMGGKCSIKECFSDYLMVNEANLGVNKANYFLYRNIEQTVEISPNFITRVLKVTYENTAKNNSWPGGNYKAYVRIYLPESTNLAELAVTDPNGAKTVYQNGDMQVNNVKGKKEVGILLEVPFASKRVLELRYSDTINLSGITNFSYLQYIQKQSGYGDTGLVVLVTTPQNMQVNQVEPAASVVGGKLLFNQKLNKDVRMGVEIGK